MVTPHHSVPARKADGITYLGNEAPWSLPKTTFLCSRKVPAVQVLKCYDWAIAMRDAGNCVMLGAHSQLEKDVLHYLLKGTQPVVLVLARGMKQQLEPELLEEVSKERLLIVSPFSEKVKRVTTETAAARNEFMVQQAQAVVVGYSSSGGSIDILLRRYSGSVKPL